jgi:hypothetical protein
VCNELRFDARGHERKTFHHYPLNEIFKHLFMDADWAARVRRKRKPPSEFIEVNILCLLFIVYYPRISRILQLGGN